MKFMPKILLSTILFAIVNINLSALEQTVLSKIQLPIKTDSTSKCKIACVKNDGALLAYIFDRNPITEARIGIVLNKHGQNALFAPRIRTDVYSTNTIESMTESGVNYKIQDEIRVITVNENSGLTILKTFSNAGYISEENISVTSNIFRFKVSAKTKEPIDNPISIDDSFCKLNKFDKFGNLISSIILKGTLATGNFLRNPSFSEVLMYQGSQYSTDLNQNVKFIYSSEIQNGFAVFYKVDDSDLLSSPNRITLDSNQNGLLTAKVNNPEQTLLNIQSSTNLIDWNTLKTIQNEPSLEIVVPANKPKEFIRAIE